MRPGGLASAAPPNIHVSAVMDQNSRTSLRGKSLSRDQLMQSKVTRTAVESFEKSLASFGGEVDVKFTVSDEQPPGLQRVFELMTGVKKSDLDAAVPPDSPWVEPKRRHEGCSRSTRACGVLRGAGYNRRTRWEDEEDGQCLDSSCVVLRGPVLPLPGRR